jgi:hypothetical protein
MYVHRRAAGLDILYQVSNMNKDMYPWPILGINLCVGYQFRLLNNKGLSYFITYPGLWTIMLYPIVDIEYRIISIIILINDKIIAKGQDTR